MSNRFWTIAIGVVLGLAGGFAYWFFIGCDEGCAIRSSWWKMSLYGGFMGGFALDSVRDLQQRRKGSSKSPSADAVDGASSPNPSDSSDSKSSN